ncbi:MAG: helix-turn-helix domain-containing protein [Bacteroidota bacterium]
MKIETFNPKNEELKKYVESYYILEHSENDIKISYLTFPSLYSIVAVVNTAENVVLDDKIITKFSKSKSLATSLVCRFNEPICFEYQGNVKEICLYFKPLGLNAFLKKDLANFSHSSFNSFVPFSDYELEMKGILDIKDRELLVENLEKYWLSKLNGFTHPFLSEAISKIDENLKITTAKLASEFNVSQKTLISQFKKHLCKTPSEYKKILRFRKAVAEMKGSNEKTSLTELSHIIDFFDQSHMIANFKSLTKLPPRAFFKNLTTMGNSNVHWIYL